MRSRKKAAL